MGYEEYRKYLERRLISLMEELEYTRGQLRALDNGEYISESESEDEHFYLDNINGI